LRRTRSLYPYICNLNGSFAISGEFRASGMAQACPAVKQGAIKSRVLRLPVGVVTQHGLDGLGIGHR
jgi:hypothetical protein